MGQHLQNKIREAKTASLLKAIGSAIGCSIFMFLAWSALFPATLRYDNFITKMFTFLLCVLFDLIFCLAMFSNFVTYRYWQKTEKEIQ